MLTLIHKLLILHLLFQTVFNCPVYTWRGSEFTPTNGGSLNITVPFDTQIVTYLEIHIFVEVPQTQDIDIYLLGNYLIDYSGDGANLGTSANPAIFKETAPKVPPMQASDAPWAGMALYPYYSPFFDSYVYN